MIIFESVATPPKEGPTWIVRDANEYIDVLEGHNLILDSHFIISSPFYECGLMWLPYRLVRRILSMPKDNKIKHVYSEVLVRITKHVDKLWKSKKKMD